MVINSSPMSLLVKYPIKKKTTASAVTAKTAYLRIFDSWYWEES